MLENALFATLFVAVPIIALALYRLAGLRFFRPSPASVFIPYLLTNAYLGIWPMFFELSPRSVLRGVTDHHLVWVMFGLAAATVLLTALGFVLTPGAVNVRSPAIKEALTPPGMMAVIGLLLVCLVVLALYIISLPQVPLFAALRGETAEAVALRTALSTSNYVQFGKPQYFNTFIRVLMPFLVYVLVAQAIVRRRKSTWLLAAIGLVLASFGTVIDTAKGVLVGLLLGCFLTYVVVRGGTLKFRQFAVGLLALVVVSGVMMVWFMGTATDNWGILADTFFDRLFVGNLAPAYHVLDMFRDGDWLWGRSFPNPRGLFPFEQFDLDTAIWLRLQEDPTTEAIYTAPSVLWAEMYANFGVGGVIVTAPAVGMFLKLLHSALNAVRSGPVKAALVAFASVYFTILVTKGLPFILFLPFDYYLMSVAGSTAIIVFTDRKWRRWRRDAVASQGRRRAAALRLQY
jgi:oligosaccharide repeat unit polymerase